MSLRRTPVPRVLHRPNLVLGGERELTLMTAIVAGGLGVTGQNIPTATVAALLWFGLLPLFRWMAKADPRMSVVYVRSLKYRRYYPPRSRPFVGESMSPATQWAIILAGAGLIGAALYWAL